MRKRYELASQEWGLLVTPILVDNAKNNSVDKNELIAVRRNIKNKNNIL